MNIKQILWGFILQNGYHTNGKFSFYGGEYYHFDKNLDYTGKDEKKIYHNNLLTHIKQIGIDWVKTSEPIGESQNSFEGTFCESSKSEWLVGDLYLLDGTILKMVYTDPDGMGSYIKKMVGHMYTINAAEDFMKNFK